MADSSSSLPSLFEKISYKRCFLRSVDLTMLGLLFSLLLYRILHMSQNDNVWVVAFLCESFFTFIWLLITCIKWTPAEHKPYPDRLDERVHELPSVDMFVTTADPVREPPILVVNTVLSLLAVNYPANKLACYVSDDGCSPLTYFSLKEACNFAKIWVPFCKKYNVRVRAPFRYFLNSLDAKEDSEFSRDWEMTKREYEKLSGKVEDATRDWDADDDFEAFSNTKPNDHSTIVKVVWENKGGVGDEKELPHFVYVSREKRPNYLHHYKAGAMNFLVRVSGLMTNAPYMLNVDCDMFVNEADVHLSRGFAGIQGSIYSGSGCFHTRRVMYGLSVDDLEEDGSLSSVNARKFLDEESLARKFGSSKEIRKSVANALQRKSNSQNILTNFLDEAREVGHCQYESQKSWGKTIGWLYDSTAEDVNTSIDIHSRGWTSSYIYPDEPAFLGCMPPGGPEAMVQQRRWGTGMLEVLFNKHSPLIGIFSQKLRFRQRLAYIHIFTWGLRSIPELAYCLLPAYCLLHNSALFPKSFWRIKATCIWLFSIIDIIFKLLGVSRTVFIVTKKTFTETRSGTGDGPSCSADPNAGKFEFDDSVYFLPGTFIVLVNLAAIAGFSVGLQPLTHIYGGGGSTFVEACACILVVMLFLPFLKGLFEKGKYGIPLSTLSKAAFLAVLFVVFSVGK
ncbi:hypothetical protein BRARA_D01968 [Brassica rapa]|uniref:Glycosyltransferase 2-like domain-containing protein n=1 Tax=Brassica campestris TaxID=3711 RepID=A0A397ZR67_BRACM|nr:hypothetical protein BRARA_D01968 [Brassica rapa]